MGTDMNNKQHVFIIGSKGIPAAYGGFETFVDKLTEYQKNKNIQYYVACACDEDNYEPSKSTFKYNGATCFTIKWRRFGSSRAIFYDIDALKYSIEYIKKNQIKNPIIYILACRIGPFIGHYKKKIQELGGKIYVNPDGHEWKRRKWSAPIRKYWKFSEKLMVKHADLLICDSKNIEKYIQEDYKKYKPNTTFIAYGAETKKSLLKNNEPKLSSWYQEKGLKEKEYYLVVGRFVPENNFETMIREFMCSKTKKDFAIITTANDTFLEELESRLHFKSDKRIKFVGTVYDTELLKKIRENAYGYFHGHEVGGTNPSLLEALGSTDLNLLLGVGFNKEVAEDAAIYWSKKDGDLARLIDRADHLPSEQITDIGTKAKQRIRDTYSWQYICGRYADVFTSDIK